MHAKYAAWLTAQTHYEISLDDFPSCRVPGASCTQYICPCWARLQPRALSERFRSDTGGVDGFIRGWVMFVAISSCYSALALLTCAVGACIELLQ